MQTIHISEPTHIWCAHRRRNRPQLCLAIAMPFLQVSQSAGVFAHCPKKLRVFPCLNLSCMSWVEFETPEPGIRQGISMLVMPLSHCDFALRVVSVPLITQTLKSIYGVQQWSGVNAVSFFAPQIFAGEPHAHRVACMPGYLITIPLLEMEVPNRHGKHTSRHLP